MKITWLGHSCFCIECEGYRIVIDPYDDSCGYPPLSATANAVLASHSHHDHNNFDAIAIKEKKDNPFTIRAVASFHDECAGAKRGENMIYVLSANGYTVVHLGDLGHMLSDKQIKEIGHCDALLIPVGGVYTIDGETAKKVADALAPRLIIPMHYKSESYGFAEISGVEPFIAGYAPNLVRKTADNTIELEQDTAKQVVCLSFKPQLKG